MSVDGLRCILYARIYIPYMHTILYYYVQTGRPPVPISSELNNNNNNNDRLTAFDPGQPG